MLSSTVFWFTKIHAILSNFEPRNGDEFKQLLRLRPKASQVACKRKCIKFHFVKQFGRLHRSSHPSLKYTSTSIGLSNTSRYTVFFCDIWAQMKPSNGTIGFLLTHLYSTTMIWTCLYFFRRRWLLCLRLMWYFLVFLPRVLFLRFTSTSTIRCVLIVWHLHGANSSV